MYFAKLNHMKYTRLLKIIFESYKQSLSVAEFQSFENYVNCMMTKIIDDLAKLPPGAERGKKIQDLMDIEVSLNLSAQVTCHKGCSFCCHLNVEITEDDAVVALEGVNLLQYKIDEDHLSKLSKREKRDERWLKGVVPDNRCIFLDENGACGIYLYRPTICRKVIVTNEPKECFDIDGKVLPVYMPKAEIILSAALNLPDNNVASMAIMVAEKRQSSSIDILDILPTLTSEKSL
jgi:Fe-S-cluster containining protein